MRYDNIQFAVAIYIRDHQEPVRVSAGGVADPRLESAVAAAQQHNHCAVAFKTRALSAKTKTQCKHVQFAVTVHICDRDLVGPSNPESVGHRGLECSVAISDQHAHPSAGAPTSLVPH